MFAGTKTLEWDAAELPEAPTSPETLQQAGLTLGFVNDLILRTLYAHGALLGLEMARHLCLPFKVIDESLKFLKDEKCVEVTGGDLIGRVSYRFTLTELGRRRAQEAMAQCLRGTGPCAPGRLCGADLPPGGHRHQCQPGGPADFVQPSGPQGRVVQRHWAGHRQRQVGVHLWSPGNGKTSIARSVGDFMNQSGGEIYVPYAFLAENSIITVYDQALHQMSDTSVHERVEDQEATIRRLLNTGTVDQRWVRIKRPVVITGGELNLGMLDLRFNAASNFYQAPLHVKANSGIFLIDDFGRQLCSPKELLNRWILPLEDRHDFLSLASGKKFEVPFEQLTIFSTNLDPKSLVDDAFLRRIRHKVEVEAPSRDIYEKIFHGVAKRLGMNSCPEAIDYLYQRYYSDNRSPRASDCRDLLETVQSICRFRKQPIQLTRNLMVEASASFICEFK